MDKLTTVGWGSDPSLVAARVIISGKNEIIVSWYIDLTITCKYIRYKTERGRTGDK